MSTILQKSPLASVHEAQNVEEIITWAKKLRTEEPGGWIFRGQAHDWPLCAGIFRSGVRRLPTGEALEYLSSRDLPDEVRALEEFKRKAHMYLGIPPKNVLEWLALAQHYELPTRLLDWTTSPLVAAYFACEKMAIPAEAGSIVRDRIGKLFRPYELRRPVIYAMPLPQEMRLHTVQQGMVLEELVRIVANKIFSYRPPVISPQIETQESIFTIQNENYIFEAANLRTLKIKCREENDRCYEGKILEDLYGLGIHEQRLYPGLHGVAATIKWCHKWQK